MMGEGDLREHLQALNTKWAFVLLCSVWRTHTWAILYDVWAMWQYNLLFTLEEPFLSTCICTCMVRVCHCMFERAFLSACTCVYEQSLTSATGWRDERQISQLAQNANLNHLKMHSWCYILDFSRGGFFEADTVLHSGPRVPWVMNSNHWMHW